MRIARTVRACATAAVTAGLAAGALAAAPTAASARPGGTYVESFGSDAVVCRTTTTDERSRVQARVYRDDRGGSFFQMQVFDNFGNIELVEEAFGEATWSDDAVRGVGPLYDPAGEPLPGESTMSATYTVATSGVTTTQRSQEGNQRIVATTTTTPFTLTSVEVTVPGYDLNALDCTASNVAQTLTYTTPAKFVDAIRSFETNSDVGCYLDETGEVSARIVGRELTLVISNLAGPLADAAGSLHLNGDVGRGILTLTSEDGQPAGTAAASAQITKIGPTVAEQFVDEDFFTARRSTPYRLDLAVTLPDGTRTVGCRMDQVMQRIRVDIPR